MGRSTRVLGIVLLTALGILTGAILVAAEGGPGGALGDQYKQRLDRTDKKNPDSLVALAKWCLQNGLLELANQNALDALALSPDDVRAKYLLYALQVGGGEETTEEGGSGGGGGGKVTISQKDTDAIWTREGDVAMTRFKNQVQGMLFLRCGMPQCHGGNKQAKYQLVRQGPGSRRTIAQNFNAINNYINREKPEDSPLIQKPLKGPEAGHPKKAITSPTDPMYLALRDWIKTLKTEGAIMWGNVGKEKPKSFAPEKVPEKTPAKATKAPPKAAEATESRGRGD